MRSLIHRAGPSTLTFLLAGALVVGVCAPASSHADTERPEITETIDHASRAAGRGDSAPQPLHRVGSVITSSIRPSDGPTASASMPIHGDDQQGITIDSGTVAYCCFRVEVLLAWTAMEASSCHSTTR
jgi:hypothetical protein